MRSTCIAIVAALAAAWTFAPSPVAAADVLTLKAEAGLGGVTRPGRWTPVRISVENDGQDLSGELVVEWGSAIVHRNVRLAAPSRSQVDVYVRTPDVRDAITVRLRSHDTEVRAIDVPIRIVSSDGEVTLCVLSAGSLATDTTECTASVTPDALPRSMRGYDAADRVVWGAGPEEVLAADQRTALEQWRAYRRLEDAGVLSLAPRLPSPAAGRAGPGRSLSMVAVVLGGYVLLILGAGSLARGTRGRPLRAYAAIGLVVAIASSVGLVAGRSGPASAIVVRHTSTLQQLPGGGALVTMRGVAEYPAFSAFHLRALGNDSTLETKPSPRSEQWFDEDGYPLLSGVFGLGWSQPFTLEGVVGLSWLTLERRAAVIHATNVSTGDLHDCRFPDGFSPQRVETLRAGQTVDATELKSVGAPFFVCSLERNPLDFSDARYPVDVDGVSLVAAYIPSDVADAEVTR